MGGIPGFRGRRVVQPHAVVMSDHGAAFGTAACPVLAGLLGSRSVRIGAGQDVVPVGIVAPAVDGIALLVESRVLGNAIGIAVQGGDIVRDLFALDVVPGAASDPVACIGLVRA